MESGLHRISIEDHHKIQPAFSKSLESYMALSPAHAKAFLAQTFETTDALEFGAAFADAVLQPDTFPQKYIEAAFQDARTKEFKEWAKLQEGKTILKSDKWARIKGMEAAIFNHPSASALVSQGEPEVTATWNNEEFGCLVKARPDYMRTDNILLDLKTTDCAELNTFCRTSLYKYRYHVQAALYLDTVNAAVGKNQYDTFVIIAVEKEAPFGVTVINLDNVSIDKGRELYRKSLAKFAECLKADSWPGYPTDVQTSMPPLWALEE